MNKILDLDIITPNIYYPMLHSLEPGPCLSHQGFQSRGPDNHQLLVNPIQHVILRSYIKPILPVFGHRLLLLNSFTSCIETS